MGRKNQTQEVKTDPIELPALNVTVQDLPVTLEQLKYDEIQQLSRVLVQHSIPFIPNNIRVFARSVTVGGFVNHYLYVTYDNNGNKKTVFVG